MSRSIRSAGETKEMEAVLPWACPLLRLVLLLTVAERKQSRTWSTVLEVQRLSDLVSQTVHKYDVYYSCTTAHCNVHGMSFRKLP